MELGFWILVVSGFPDFSAVFRISKPRIPDSTSKNFPDSGIRIPLHWAPCPDFQSVSSYCFSVFFVLFLFVWFFAGL